MADTWRDYCRPIIAAALAESAGKSEHEIKKALFDAYPFGQREHHPYKIWLSEIAVQRGKKPKPGAFPRTRESLLPDPRQGTLL